MTISPRPVQILLGPWKKKDRSLPKRAAKSDNRCAGQFKPSRRSSAIKVNAPSELPPPNPAPTGIRLCSAAATPGRSPAASPDARIRSNKPEAVFTTRFEASQGIAGSSQDKPMPGTSTNVNSNLSKSPTVTIQDNNGWNPSAPAPGPTPRCRLIFAGADTRNDRAMDSAIGTTLTAHRVRGHRLLH